MNTVLPLVIITIQNRTTETLYKKNHWHEVIRASLFLKCLTTDRRIFFPIFTTFIHLMSPLITNFLVFLANLHSLLIYQINLSLLNLVDQAASWRKLVRTSAAALSIKEIWIFRLLLNVLLLIDVSMLSLKYFSTYFFISHFIAELASTTFACKLKLFLIKTFVKNYFSFFLYFDSFFLRKSNK